MATKYGNDQPARQEPVQQTAKTELPAPVKGKYADYSAEAVLAAKGDKVLFFYAPWCPQCRALEKSIMSQTLPDNLTIFKVDYDSNQALRAKYGVTLQTTLVKIDDNGNKLKSYVAYDEPTFEAVKRELFP
jgi:thiol-disulfide isomerase/thioredoxin